jgi:hypothetical protein
MDDTRSDISMEQSQQPAPWSRKLQAVLILGDTVSFLVFAAIGRGSHNEVTGFQAPLEVLKTAAPFLAGWLLIAPWLGVYRPDTPAASLLRRTALAWVLACPAGLALRMLVQQRIIPLPNLITFAAVTFITNLLLLVSWRSVFAWLVSRRR